jgi:hypothetical protein
MTRTCATNIDKNTGIRILDTNVVFRLTRFMAFNDLSNEDADNVDVSPTWNGFHDIIYDVTKEKTIIE